MNRMCHYSLAVLATCLVGAFTANLYAASLSDDNWISMGGISDVNGLVRAVVTDSVGNLYVGGQFTIAGDVFAAGVAKWNGTNWSALGSGVVGGGDVWSLAVSGSDLYVGGQFTNVGGVAANNIAKWNGTNWSGLGSGMDSSVFALAFSGSDLYAAGAFTTAGGSPAKYIAKWSGNSWNALGSGMNDRVYALAVSGGDLYAGGCFTNAGEVSANYIARWNGSNWNALGSGMGDRVYSLAILGSDLYAGGSFGTAGGVPATYLARWDGASWSAADLQIGAPVDAFVVALAVAGNDLYALVDYWYGADSDWLTRMAKWNGSDWSAVSDFYEAAMYPLVLAASGSDLYLAGEVGIVEWNGGSWSGIALPSGIGAPVRTWAMSGSDLFAGGDFATAGRTPAVNIAKWNGDSWSALGSGMNRTVFALAASGSNLYAGGWFTNAGGTMANCIAKWNGNSWTALNSGLSHNLYNAGVYAIVVAGNDLYAGGFFTMAGGSPANYIAKWNGSSWSALGSGMGPTSDSFGGAFALAVSGEDLYAAGQFTTAGGSPANYIAKWNGSSWSALGSGVNSDVFALAVSSTDLYAAGDFGTAGGIAANGIAKWNGSSWSALGSGMNARGQALAISGNELYAGGDFTMAGGKVSAGVARARIRSIAQSVALTNSTSTIQFSGVTGYQYDVQRATNLNSPTLWTTLTTSPLFPGPDGSFTFSDTSAPTGTAFYRALELP